MKMKSKLIAPHYIVQEVSDEKYNKNMIKGCGWVFLYSMWVWYFPFNEDTDYDAYK